ncbi:MAG: V-type ATP synthase subunit E, partial [Candidatus Heimdallarchaeota archaeon]|nr:V-type ATP synthase subunit E [Candidatus Heimdallarchaeota archaeon]
MKDKKKTSEEHSSPNLDNLLKKIISEAENEAEKIREDTRKNLEIFEKETKNLVINLKKKELDKEIPHLEFIRKRTEVEYQQKARKTRIQAQEKLIDAVFEKVEKELMNFRINPEYKIYLKSRLESTQRAFKTKDMKIIIDQRDENLINKTVANLQKEKDLSFIVQVSELITSGGFILTDFDERVRIDYTIEYLLEESKDVIRTKIN